MEKVTGIGGVFFKAQDPQRLAQWYRDHLGIGSSGGHTDFVWRDKDNPQQIGRTVWSIFPANADYFGPAGRPFMVNYCVADLNRMLEQLRQAGVTIEKVEEFDYGRFAWITDPEGNRVELWEPTDRGSLENDARGRS